MGQRYEQGTGEQHGGGLVSHFMWMLFRWHRIVGSLDWLWIPHNGHLHRAST